MSRISEVALAAVMTAGLLILWVVAIAAVLLPFTWLAGWWLGDEVELLNHPRRNAIVLGACVLVVFFFLEFSPDRTRKPLPSERARWWQRKRS